MPIGRVSCQIVAACLQSIGIIIIIFIYYCVNSLSSYLFGEKLFSYDLLYYL